MAKNATMTIGADAWTQLTDDDATRVMVRNDGATTAWISGTATASAPSDKGGSIKLEPGQGVNDTLSNLWPGVAAVRIYALAHHPALLTISHD